MYNKHAINSVQVGFINIYFHHVLLIAQSQAKCFYKYANQHFIHILPETRAVCSGNNNNEHLKDVCHIPQGTNLYFVWWI